MIADRLLLLMLRANAAVLLLAAPCALLPFAWMDAVHRTLLGTELPDAVITRYLTRSLSLVYAMHGAVVLTVTLNWQRYRPFVPILAWLHISFGCAMLVVDLTAALPWWWAATEGPSMVVYGIAVWFVYQRASRNEPGAQ
jgi:hypothetical protein